MSLLKKIVGVALIAICTIANAEVFVVKHIQVNGLQRISLATVLSNLQDVVKIGDQINTEETAGIIHAVYKTGFFSNVTLKRSNDDLVIEVIERSMIGSMKITGNSKLTKKELTEALRNIGIAEGQTLDQAILIAARNAIIQECYNRGLYAAKVVVDVKPIERNRVALAIKIYEGPTAKIKSIKLVGNRVFKAKVLLKELSLTTTKLWSFLTSSDQYSKEKLEADLEVLRTYYMDRGYVNIKIDTPKVTITPDKKGIYIVITLTEGEVYRLAGISLEGDCINKRPEILKLITLKPGNVFSRKEILETQNKIQMFLGDYGYGMANIKIEDQQVDEKQRKIWLKFIVIPGHRVYIRHIDFSGNHKTNDEVLRREMRLQEGSLFSSSKINESRRRLYNLGYLQDIDYKVAPIPETNNQVDLNYEVKETSAISANFQAGFSDRDGFIYGADLSDQNFLGAGKAVSIGLNNSKVTQYYHLGYRDPYFTRDKIGFSVNGYIQKNNPHKISADISSYTNSVRGILTSFDAPLSDYTQVGLGVGYEHLSVNRATKNSNEKIENFLNRYGMSYNEVKLTASLSYNNVDRALFPTNGFAHSLGVEVYGPLNGHSLAFYKLDYTAAWYRYLFKDFIFRASTELGYGRGFGKTSELLFLKNFYAGGIGSVRGFQASSITNNKEDKDRVVGGNILTVASASLIIPSPLKDTIRPSIFVDVGSVYDNYFKFGDLRASYGIQIEWRTPLVPLVFSLAKVIKKKAWDNTELFQFNISTSGGI